MSFLNSILKKTNLPLALILIVAAILRFWNYTNIPFTHDEFSALFRTQFNSFNQLITNGVMPDGHPAGIQVFLYFWVKLVGFSEVWIKLPFLIMGLASLWLMWKISVEWFSEKVAVFAASTLAFMQYFIMYSQIARPYISGLFFTLLMVMYWYRLLFGSELAKKSLIKNAFGFILGAALCSYNHYFSLLMVALVSMLGFFYIRKQNYKWYLGSLFIIAILFLPHLKIFYYQLSLQGLGWLGVPKPTFFFKYFNYLTHFNILVLACFIGILIWVLIIFIRSKEKFSKQQFIALYLGISSALIGYFYSVYRAPVLQFSVLIFSVPFFFLFVFSFLHRIKWKYVYPVVVLWSVLLIYSLIFTREYYHNFYKSIYSETFKEIKAKKTDSTIVICGFTHEIGDYYSKKLKICDTSNIIYPYLLKNKKQLYEYLENNKYNKVLIATVTNDMPSLFALCHEYFPQMVMHKYLDQGEIRLLKKGSVNYTSYTYLSFNSFNEKNVWNFNKEKTKIDSAGFVSYVIDSAQEYDVQFELYNKNEIRSHAHIIDVGAWVYLPAQFNGKAHLVASVEKDSTLLWQNFMIDGSDLPKNKWLPINTSIFLPDFVFPLDSIKIKTYFWNPEHQEFYVSKTFFGIRNSNPKIYWIYYDLLNK